MAPEPIRVVIADDSIVARDMLAQILNSDPGIKVVAQCTDGAQAVGAVERLRPDLVTMDIHMPAMDGLEATERIMAYHPTPILVVSSSVYGEGVGLAFDALTRGALEVMKKPEPRDWADLQHIGNDLIRRVKILAKVRVITHVGGRKRPGEAGGSGADRGSTVSRGGKAIVAVGSSTGGPSALQTMLGALSPALPVPVVVAQHIAEGFVPGLVQWLDQNCPIAVREAAEGEDVFPGTVYFAPTGKNLELDGMRVRFTDPRPGQLYIPSADTLFESVAANFDRRAVGVILTGMGSDGARGLKVMRDKGAATVAQDEGTSIVFGMPKAAADMGAAQAVLPIEAIAAEVQRLVAAE